MAALGEFGVGEEFCVAVVAVARAQEVDEALLGDGDGFWGCGVLAGRRSGWLLVVDCWLDCPVLAGFGGRGSRGVRCAVRDPRFVAMKRRRTWGTRMLGCARGFEGLEGDLEGVDHLAGAAGVDGVLGEAVDDGGEGDEDGGAVLDGGQLHAGDLGVDEDGVAAFGVFDVVEVAVIFAFEGGRAAALAAGGLVEVADVVAVEVVEWLWHGGTPWVSDFRIIFQTNHLADRLFCKI
jgi:hypothetical protein